MIRMLLNKKVALPFWRGWLPASSAPGRPFLLTEVVFMFSCVRLFFSCCSPVVLLCLFFRFCAFGLLAVPPPPPPNAFGRQGQRRQRCGQRLHASRSRGLRRCERPRHLHFGKWATREKMLWVGPKAWATGTAERGAHAHGHAKRLVDPQPPLDAASRAGVHAGMKLKPQSRRSAHATAPVGATSELGWLFLAVDCWLSPCCLFAVGSPAVHTT